MKLFCDDRYWYCCFYSRGDRDSALVSVNGVILDKKYKINLSAFENLPEALISIESEAQQIKLPSPTSSTANQNREQTQTQSISKRFVF